MTRLNLEHIIRAAGAIADDPDIIVIGSQAILGEHPEADPELLISKEADVFPRNRPERSDLIDGSIGEGSPFEREFGYYALGVDASTAVLPAGWQDRLVLVCGPNTRNVRGWCLETHDLAVSKLIAGREKDIEFIRTLVRSGLIEIETMKKRLRSTAVDPQIRSITDSRLDRLFTGTTDGHG